MFNSRRQSIRVICILLALAAGWFLLREKRESQTGRSKAVSLIKSWGKFPIDFIENKRQFDPRVNYLVKGGEKTLYFGPAGLTVSIHRKKATPHPIREASAALSRWNVRLDFVGANPDVKPEGEEKTGTKISYFKGEKKDWKTGIPTWRSIAYRDLWPGIDLVYSGSTDLLKQDFMVKPGSDPNKIKLAYAGTESVEITNDGGMEIVTPFGGFRDERPVAYQMIDGKRVTVSVAYDLQRKGNRYEYGFRLGPYDPTKELVIDPLTVIYAGFIGGTGTEFGYGITVDTSGNAYVTGQAFSTEASFPETVGPDLTQNGDYDAFVAKVKSDGTGLDYAGFIGGSDSEIGYDIAVDTSGNAYVTGYTLSTEASFPETVGPDLTQNGWGDAFVAKVKSDGTGLDYAGFIGGTGNDYGRGIAVDTSGNAYVTGSTDSTEATFPETVGPDLTQNGDDDGFVAKVKSDGTGLDYAGFIGGSGEDYGVGIAVNTSGNAYVTGYTPSTEATFPATVGPDLTQNGWDDAFVAKVKSDGTGLDYAGFIGGTSTEFGRNIAIDTSGNVYVTGSTASTEATFPETVGPDLTQNGDYDAFVAKVKSDGTGLDYAGFMGGSGEDHGYGIAVDTTGNAYVTGFTASTEASFSATVGPDLTQNGGNDAFVAKVKSDGTGLNYAGFMGGSGEDYGYGIAVDTTGNAYVTGFTASTEASFSVTVGPDLTQNGGNDVFVAKIGIVANCGDGTVEGDEECDDGGGNSDTTADACRTDCTDPSCGDGVTDTGEGCDDGNSSNTDNCLNICVSATCGDGNPDSGVETCDNGNNNSDTTADACRTNCINAWCGDGVTDSGDECDEGGGNSDTTADACRTDCTDPSCGDGVTDTGEGCDDGNSSNTDNCLNICVSATCGDGNPDSGVETCDNGNNNSDTTADACRTNCINAWCGDGVTDTGEECDDGNNVNGDDCNSDCNEEGCHDLEADNPHVDFFELKTGDVISLTVPFPGEEAEAEARAATVAHPPACTCAWSAEPESIGSYSESAEPEPVGSHPNNDPCETDFYPEEAGNALLTVDVDCKYGESDTFRQCIAVVAGPTDSGGCSLNR